MLDAFWIDGTIEQPKDPLEVVFTCHGQAVGKMRNDLDVKMVEPMLEEFTLATAPDVRLLFSVAPSSVTHRQVHP